MSPYAKMCVSAAAVRACCANLIRGEPESFPSEASGGAASGKPGEDSFWVQDLAAATENALLQIVEEGLGGVWLGWYPDSGRVKVFSDRFKLPGHIIPVSLIALGYPARETHPKDRFDPLRVHYESWEA
jgi:nitroreductase